MKEVFRAFEFTEVGYYQSIVESAGIATLIRNQTPELIGAGETPIAYPSLWVLDEADGDKALAIIRELLKERELTPGADVPCPLCHEPNPSNFEICWNCGGSLTVS
jgi:hypothetical protein